MMSGLIVFVVFSICPSSIHSRINCSLSQTTSLFPIFPFLCFALYCFFISEQSFRSLTPYVTTVLFNLSNLLSTPQIQCIAQKTFQNYELSLLNKGLLYKNNQIMKFIVKLRFRLDAAICWERCYFTYILRNCLKNKIKY